MLLLSPMVSDGDNMQWKETEEFVIYRNIFMAIMGKIKCKYKK